MKSTISLLIMMLVFVGGTAWLAQEWRLQATTYLTTKERDGDILRQQLVSEGDKLRAETEAEFHSRGLKDAAEILALTDGDGRKMIAAAELERTRIKSTDVNTITEYVLSPLQGTTETENDFLAKSLDENNSKEDREAYRTLYNVVFDARKHVLDEYDIMLHYVGKAMSDHSNCESNTPSFPLIPVPADPFARHGQ